MADKSFGVEQVDIFGSGTPTIQSPNDLNINAVNVAISTNVSVGAALTVGAGLNATGVSTFNGYLNAASRLYFDENTGTKYMFGSGVDLLTTISSEGDWKLTLNASGGTGGNFIVEKSSGNSLLEAKGTGAVDITGDLNVTGISTFNDNVLLGDSDIFGLGDAGFNGFSQLAMGTFDDVNAISKIAVNTHLAGAAGTVSAAVVSRLLGGKTDIIMMLNGALAGLVAITAEPLTPSPLLAIVIGAIGAIIMYFGTKFLEARHLDDVVGKAPSFDLHPTFLP